MFHNSKNCPDRSLHAISAEIIRWIKLMASSQQIWNHPNVILSPQYETIHWEPCSIDLWNLVILGCLVGGIEYQGVEITHVFCIIHRSSEADLSKQDLGKSLSFDTNNHGIYATRPCPVQRNFEFRHQSPWDKWCWWVCHCPSEPKQWPCTMLTAINFGVWPHQPLDRFQQHEDGTHSTVSLVSRSYSPTRNSIGMLP